MSEHSDREPNVVVERRSGGGIGLFLLGAVVGAGLALLYAPQAGVDTRADLRRGARRARRKAREFAAEATDAVQDVVQDVVHDVQDVVRSGRAAARDVAGEAREALERRLARHGRAAGDDER